MSKADLSLDKIVCLDKDDLKIILEYLDRDIDLKEKQNLEEALEYYRNHSSD
jgi:hypothetical protein